MTDAECLERVRDHPRDERHPLIYEVHQEEGIDRWTLFYGKEYGSEAVVWRTIVRESLPILIVALLLSSIGTRSRSNTRRRSSSR